MVVPIPGAEALIERIIRQARARMIRREAIVTRALLTSYERSWRRIDAEVRLLEAQYRQALRAGIDVTPEWITRQAYWRGLQSSIEAEFVRFEGNASRVLGAGQAEAVTAARADAIALLEGLGLPGIGGELRPARMERWVSALQPRSPLRGVIRRYGAAVQTAIQDEITEGLGMGRGSSSVIRSIRDRIGPEAMTPRINTLVRTEMHRTYRGAQREQYDALKDEGIIVGYRWQASLSSRTCGACLAMHGRVFDEYPSGHHPNCRCTVRPVVDPALLPGGSAPAASGEEWLRQQDERTQLLALGSRGRLEAFREGMSLEEMVTIRPNETWGPSVGLTRPGAGGSLPGEFNRGSGGAGSGPETPDEPETWRFRARPVERIIMAEEDAIRRIKTHETAILYGPDGREIFRKDGGSSSVSFSEDEFRQMRGGILTHNHPLGWGRPPGDPGAAGSSFSKADITLFQQGGLAEIRAVSPGYRHSLRRPAGGSEAFDRIGLEDFRLELSRVDDEVRGEFWPRIHSGQMSIPEAEATHGHELSRRIAERYGLEYERVEWSPFGSEE